MQQNQRWNNSLVPIILWFVQLSDDTQCRKGYVTLNASHNKAQVLSLYISTKIGEIYRKKTFWGQLSYNWNDIHKAHV